VLLLSLVLYNIVSFQAFDLEQYYKFVCFFSLLHYLLLETVLYLTTIEV